MKTPKLIVIILAVACIVAAVCYFEFQLLDENSDSGITPEENTPSDDHLDKVPEKLQMIIQIGDYTFKTVLEDNDSVRALIQKLPLDITMRELNNNEKYYRFSESLPTDEKSVGEIHTGDIMLYRSNYLVLFYDNFSTSYDYTRLGHIEDPTELAQALGDGNVRVVFNNID